MARTSRKVFVARESFFIDDNGTPVMIAEGERVREGHPYLRGREQFFHAEPEKLRHDVETATSSNRKADDE